MNVQRKKKGENIATNEHVTEQKRINPIAMDFTYIQKLELAVCQKYYDRTSANPQEM